MVVKSSNFKRILQVMILLIVVVAAEVAATYCMVLPNDGHHFNYDVKRLIDDKEDVDMILIGASRSQRTFVPYIIEEELGFDNVLNASSPLQPISGNYYMLKYLLDEFEPKYIVVGVTWDGLVGEDELEYNSVLTMERLPLADRIPYVLDVYPNQILSLSNLYWYRDVLKQDDWLEECKKRYKELASIRNGTKEIDTTATEYYVEKGFVYNRAGCKEGSFTAGHSRYDSNQINYDKLKYLDKIVKLCKEKEIKLYLVAGLTSMSRIYSIENYQEADDFYREYAEANDLKYYNFNYLVDREEFLPDTLMYDNNHVNAIGAEMISRIFSEVIRRDNNGESSDEFFYSSVDELKESVRRIVAAGATVDVVEGMANVETRCLANEDMVPEYRISLIPEGSEALLLSDFSSATKYCFDVSEYEEYSLKVEVRQKGHAEIDACTYAKSK